MPARHFSSVLLPEPLRPTIPKNSPFGTTNETSSRAWRRSKRARLKGWTARSLSVETFSWGSRKAFETPSTTTAGALSCAAVTARNLAVGLVAAAPLQAHERQRVPDDGEHDADRHGRDRRGHRAEQHVGDQED